MKVINEEKVLVLRRGLLRDCKTLHNLREGLFEALITMLSHGPGDLTSWPGVNMHLKFCLRHNFTSLCWVS